ncbi:hypothetical protein NBRC116584_11440 [Hydrogenophaga sp. 5NK40-0174]
MTPTQGLGAHGRARLWDARWMWAVAVVATMWAASEAHAGRIYQYIDENGNRVLSDKPPGRAGTPRSAADQKLASKAGSGRMDEEVLDAAVRVMGTESMIKAMTDFCDRMVPTVAPTVRQARDDWFRANGKLVVSKGVIFKKMLRSGQRQELELRARQDASTAMGVLDKLTPQEREAECRRMPEMFATPEYNLVKNPEVEPLVMGYRSRR